MNTGDGSTSTGRLTQLVPGTCVPGPDNDVYEIEAFLGLGLTAQVYRAKRESDNRVVALKVLRDDASDTSTEYFWHEAWVLKELNTHGVKAVPEVLAQKDEGDSKFLALEFLDHDTYRPLDELLETDPLPEAQALEITRQALEVLNVLHTEVKRTYTDMQLKNFLWNAEADPPTLKIIDWNHVSTQEEYIQLKELQHFGVKTFDELKRRDLARLGAYFYRMLTGKGALERGEPRGILARRAGPRWEVISVAARQVLVKALHPDPAKRYQTAADFFEAITFVQSLWKDPIDKEEVQNQYGVLRKSEQWNEEIERQVEELWALLDMLELRNESTPTLMNYKKQMLEKWLRPGNTRPWSNGKRAYDETRYSDAISIWEAETSTQARSSLYRWLMLAQTGQTHPDDFANIKDDLAAVVNALSEEPGQETYGGKAVDVESVRRDWDTIVHENPRVKSAPISVLEKELKAEKAIRDGDLAAAQQNWEQAQKQYETANEALKAIEYADILCEERGWQDLEQRLENARANDALAADRAKATNNLREELAQNVKRGLKRLKWHFISLPENEALARFCLNYAQELVPLERATNENEEV